MNEDTITALATPPGTGGIAVIRISGNQSKFIIDKCFKGKNPISTAKTHTIHYGCFYDNDNFIDTVLVSYFASPNSYTGEDIIEVSCHGGSIPAKLIVNALLKQGARHAEPGEFTKRAFLNGKIDLASAEAIADLIHSISIPGAQTAAKQLQGKFTEKLSTFRKKLLDICSLLEIELDFSEEDIIFTDKEKIKNEINSSLQYCEELANSYSSSQILRSGLYVALVGYPNSGKSTLFNTLLQKERSIVSPQPGTTRDYIEESFYIANIPIIITDTAGLRETEDLIEIEGIKFVQSVLSRSNMILIINDSTISSNDSINLLNKIKTNYKETKVILLNNKIDKIDESNLSILEAKEQSNSEEIINISAKYGFGIEKIKSAIEREASKSIDIVKDALLNKRQESLLQKSAEYLKGAKRAIDDGFENEIISINIRKAAEMFGRITGDNFNEEVLNNIFSKFCIGK